MINIKTIGPNVQGVRLMHVLLKIQRPDWTPLLLDWAGIATEDNRRGVLMGLNAENEPMREPKYRTSVSASKYRTRTTRKFPNARPTGPDVAGVNRAEFGSTATFNRAVREGLFGTNDRFNRKHNKNRLHYAYLGGAKYPKNADPLRLLRNNNLTTAGYKRLKGPPLAPRGVESRVIRYQEFELVQNPQRPGVRMVWRNIKNAKGEPFMHYNFAKPTWDLRGLRPWGEARCRKALNQFLVRIFRGA